jgi:hypothetical protein
LIILLLHPTTSSTLHCIKSSPKAMEDDSRASRSTEEEEEEEEEESYDEDDYDEESDGDRTPSPNGVLLAAIDDRESLSVVQEIAERRPELLLVPSVWGDLPIHLAVDAKDHPEQLELVRHLAEQCPASLLVATNDGEPDDLQWQSDGGKLPIHAAASAEGPRQLDVARYLAQACPEALGARTTHGHLPVERALQVGAPVAVVRVLFRHLPGTVSEEAKLGLLHFAIAAPRSLRYNRHLENVLFLVTLPGSLRAKRSRCARILVRYRPSDGFRRTLQGSTALHVAVHRTTREDLPPWAWWRTS